MDKEVLEFQKQLEQKILFHYLQLDSAGNFVNPPKTDEQLDEFIRLAYGVNFPKKIITPGHRPAFYFIADLFFERTKNALGFASRNGGKTWAVALLNHLDMMFKPGCEIASSGSVKDQADKCYRYFKGFNELPWFKRLSEQFMVATGEPLYRPDKSIRSKTEFGNGSLIEIITASEKGFRGPHPHKNRIDEIDELDWSVFQTGLMMAQSSENIRGQNVFTSTRQHSAGTMQRLLDEAHAKGIEVYEWNCWEMLERCDRRCSNDPDHGNCPIFTFCEGKAHSCAGFYKIDDFIDKVRMLDRDRFETEWLNSKPSRHKVVYPMFEPSRHVLSRAKFQQLTGRTEPSWNWPMISAIDFGSSPGHPFVYAKYVRIPTGAWVVWWEYVAEQRLLRDHANAIKTCSWWSPSEMAFADWDAQDRLELQNLGIYTRRATKGKDSVSVGIDFISSLLKGFPPKEEPMLYVMDWCVNHIHEFNQYQWPTRADGKPDKSGRPLQENDHCFVAGTKLLTSRGEVSIEDIKVGDLVLTREGWKRVVACGMTSESSECFEYFLPNGRSFVCTASHPIYTVNRGFLPVSEARLSDHVLCLSKNAYSKELLFGDIQSLTESRMLGTSSAVLTSALLESDICIDQSGRSLTDPFRRNTKFTTQTEISPTTLSRISKRFRRPSICPSMLSVDLGSVATRTLSISTTFGQRQLLGIGRKKGECGIHNMPERLSSIERLYPDPVCIVESSSRQFQKEPSSVQQSADLQTEDFRDQTPSRCSAISADQVSAPIDSNLIERVQDLADLNFVGRFAGRHPVFNVTVEGCPEYFANGVLVHNCMDALRYGLFSYRKQYGSTKYKGSQRRW